MTSNGITGPGTAIHRLAGMVVSSRNELITAVEAVLGDSLIHKIDSHNTASLLFIFHDSAMPSYSKYVLKAEYGHNTATEKEIDWYARSKSYDFIPKLVAGEATPTHSLLLLEHIDKAQTLDDLAEMGSDSTFAYYQKAIELDRKIYHESMPRKATLGEMDRFYTRKLTRRLQEAAHFDYLRELITKDTLIINGKEYRSLNHYIEKITSNATLNNYLMPHELGLIHGDLHGGNILVASGHIYFVDPNGNRKMPLEYDYGKVLHTIHGRYPAIMNRSYALTQDNEGYIFQLTKTDVETYSNMKKLFDDPELMRGLYAEAMHFATMLPHHASNKQETTALFLRTIELFDELCYVMSIK